MQRSLIRFFFPNVPFKSSACNTDSNRKIILNDKKNQQIKLSIRQFLASVKKINIMFSTFLAVSEWSKLLKELNFNNKYRIAAKMYQPSFLS